MKVFILFKLKDSTSKKKEYIVDNLYADMGCVNNRIGKLLRKDKKQDFYCISKSVRGRIKISLKSIQFIASTVDKFGKVKLNCTSA